jgi:putative oxidoreductase
MATYVEPSIERRVAPRRSTTTLAPSRRFLVPLGRALFAAIFIAASFGHFSAATIGLASQQGLPFASVLVPLSGIIALVGGAMVLLGYHARLGGWLLVLFLLPVTFTMHNFWAISDPAARAMQQGMFMKNLALLGGAFLIIYWGAGPVSLDNRRVQACA